MSTSLRRPDGGTGARMYANNLAIQSFLTKRQQEIRAQHTKKGSLFNSLNVHNVGNRILSGSPSHRDNHKQSVQSALYIDTDTERGPSNAYQQVNQHSLRLTPNTERRAKEEKNFDAEIRSMNERMLALERKFEFQETALKEAVSVIKGVQESQVRQVRENQALQDILAQIRDCKDLGR